MLLVGGVIVENLLEIYNRGIINRKKYSNYEVSDRVWTVYRHIAPNGKQYFGMTSTKPEERWGKDGYNYRKQLFGRVIDKYGWENIESEIICQGDNKVITENFEMLCIDYFDTTNPEKGYNIHKGGTSGAKGYRHTEEAKRNMSINRSGKNNYFYGQTMTNEQRKKISETKKKQGDGVGERNPDAKLTEEIVKYCREVYIFRDKEFGIRPLAKRFGVAESTMGNVVNRRSWKHI